MRTHFDISLLLVNTTDDRYPAARIAGEHRSSQIHRDLITTLARLGYLPSGAKEIQSTIDRKASRQALMDDISNSYFPCDLK